MAWSIRRRQRGGLTEGCAALNSLRPSAMPRLKYAAGESLGSSPSLLRASRPDGAVRQAGLLETVTELERALSTSGSAAGSLHRSELRHQRLVPIEPKEGRAQARPGVRLLWNCNACDCRHAMSFKLKARPSCIPCLFWCERESNFSCQSIMTKRKVTPFFTMESDATFALTCETLQVDGRLPSHGLTCCADMIETRLVCASQVARQASTCRRGMAIYVQPSSWLSSQPVQRHRGRALASAESGGPRPLSHSSRRQGAATAPSSLRECWSCCKCWRSCIHAC